jgi:hypothetical protein
LGRFPLLQQQLDPNPDTPVAGISYFSTISQNHPSFHASAPLTLSTRASVWIDFHLIVIYLFAISEQIVAQQRGSIQVASKSGQGTSFVIRIPQAVI